MSILHLKPCKYRIWNSDKNEITCKLDKCIKSVDNCIECMKEMT